MQTKSKYTQSIQILQEIKQGNHTPDHQKKHLTKTLLTKGYLTRNGKPNQDYSLTEKGAKTLEEYNKMKKIIEKPREGTHPSKDHPDR